MMEIRYVGGEERQGRRNKRMEGSYHGWVDQEERGWEERGGFGVDYDEEGGKRWKTSITYLLHMGSFQDTVSLGLQEL